MFYQPQNVFGPIAEVHDVPDVQARNLRKRRCLMRKPMIAVIAFAAFLGSLPGAGAQTYPSRPITMIVPLAAGGSTDIIGRLMAEGMRAALGQPIVVENVTGAGGNLRVGPLPPSTPD